MDTNNTQADNINEASGDPITERGFESFVPEPDRAPARKRARRESEFADDINALLTRVGADTDSYEASLVRDLIDSALKLIPDGRHSGELKLVSAAVKEMRYAYRVFARYPQPKKITIFGSARTPEDHPDYIAAVEFSKLMADHGWMVITGAGGGIMQAGHVGPGREQSFGVAIRLPFETTANHVITGDDKLIHFRYFFTRKLMFLSQSQAIALFPGGFGTMDEAYEALTLIQTGKAPIMPIVLLEGAGNTYWEKFDTWVRTALLDGGFISADDLHLYHIAHTAQEACDHVRRFYKNYHSSRYVGDQLVIRIRHPLSHHEISTLADEFAVLIADGTITQQQALPQEQVHLDLPRLVFTHTKHKFGLLRALIDRINMFDTP